MSLVVALCVIATVVGFCEILGIGKVPTRQVVFMTYLPKEYPSQRNVAIFCYSDGSCAYVGA